MNLTREGDLIFSLAQIDRSLKPGRNMEGMDWPFIVRTLIDNRLAGLAYWRFLSFPDFCPKEHLDNLKEQYLVNQFINIMLLQEAERIFATLQGTGIESIALKGITLLEDVFPLGARKLGDIDLMVRPEQAQESVRVLQNLGYQIGIPFRFDKGYADLHLKKGAQTVPVDLSWKFLHRTWLGGRQSSSFDALMQRVIRKKVSGAEILILHPVDQIVHTAAHAALHHELNFMPGLVDIYALITKDNGFDWRDLERTAERYGLLRSVTTVLGIMKQAFDIQLPEQVLRRWRRLYRSLSSGPEAVFLNRYWILGADEEAEVRVKKGGLKRNIARFFWRLKLCDSWAEKVTGLFREIWPSEERIEKTYRPSGKMRAFLFRLVHAPLFSLIILIGLLVVYVIAPFFYLLASYKDGSRI